MFVSSLTANTSRAQNKDSVAVRRYYEENSILWMGKYKYIKNNQTYPLRKLDDEFVISKDASWEWIRYKGENTKFKVGLLVTGGLLAIGILTKNRGAKYTFLAGGIISLGFTYSFSRKSKKHMHKAVWYYNRDILLR